MSTLASRDDRKSIRRRAWTLAIFAICVYVGYFLWNWLRGRRPG